MEPIKKILFCLFIVMTFNLGSYAMVTNGEIKNPQLIKETDGFVVYGLSLDKKKKQFIAIKYDLNLKEVKRITLPIKKYKTPFFWKTSNEYNLKFGMFKGEIFKLDKEFNLISSTDFGKDYIEKGREISQEENYDNYLPHFYSNDYIRKIEIGDFLIELKYPNHISTYPNHIPTGLALTNVNKFEYKGETILIGFKKNKESSFGTYKKEWSLDLKEFKDIDNIGFYEIDKDRCLLYFSNFENEKREEFFYFFNYKTGELFFKKKFELQDSDLSSFVSNMYYDKIDDEFIIFGNYFSKSKMASLPKSKRDSQMHGYFINKMTLMGNTELQKTYNFDFPLPNDGEDFERTLLAANKIIKQADGSYQILCENIRLRYSPGSTTISNPIPGSSYTKTTTTGSFDNYQTFGFSLIDFSKDLEKKEKLFIPFKYIKNEFLNSQLNDFDKKAPSNTLMSTYYEQDIQDLIFMREQHLYGYLIKYSLLISNNVTDRFVYNTGTLNIGEKQVLVKINGDKITQDIINESGDLFEKDSKSYYKFSTKNDTFFLEEIKY